MRLRLGDLGVSAESVGLLTLRAPSVISTALPPSCVLSYIQQLTAGCNTPQDCLVLYAQPVLPRLTVNVALPFHDFTLAKVSVHPLDGLQHVCDWLRERFPGAVLHARGVPVVERGTVAQLVLQEDAPRLSVRTDSAILTSTALLLQSSRLHLVCPTPPQPLDLGAWLRSQRRNKSKRSVDVEYLGEVVPLCFSGWKVQFPLVAEGMKPATPPLTRDTHKMYLSRIREAVKYFTSRKGGKGARRVTVVLHFDRTHVTRMDDVAETATIGFLSHHVAKYLKSYAVGRAQYPALSGTCNAGPTLPLSYKLAECTVPAHDGTHHLFLCPRLRVVSVAVRNLLHPCMLTHLRVSPLTTVRELKLALARANMALLGHDTSQASPVRAFADAMTLSRGEVLGDSARIGSLLRGNGEVWDQSVQHGAVILTTRQHAADSCGCALRQSPSFLKGVDSGARIPTLLCTSHGHTVQLAAWPDCTVEQMLHLVRAHIADTLGLLVPDDTGLATGHRRIEGATQLQSLSVQERQALRLVPLLSPRSVVVGLDLLPRARFTLLVDGGVAPVQRMADFLEHIVPGLHVRSVRLSRTTVPLDLSLPLVNWYSPLLVSCGPMEPYGVARVLTDRLGAQAWLQFKPLLLDTSSLVDEPVPMDVDELGGEEEVQEAPRRKRGRQAGTRNSSKKQRRSTKLHLDDEPRRIALGLRPKRKLASPERFFPNLDDGGSSNSSAAAAAAAAAASSPPATEIKLHSPIGGETFAKGDRITVRWTWPVPPPKGPRRNLEPAVYVALVSQQEHISDDVIYTLASSVRAQSQEFSVEIPEHVNVGTYCVEVGSIRPPALGRSVAVQVVAAQPGPQLFQQLMAGQGEFKPDNGVFCDCGMLWWDPDEATPAKKTKKKKGGRRRRTRGGDDSDDSDGPAAGSACLWLSCAVCLSWQHGKCVGIKTPAKIPEAEYVCPRCAQDQILRTPPVRQVLVWIRMLTELSNYKRRRGQAPAKRQFGSMYEEILSTMNKQQLRRLCYERGVSSYGSRGTLSQTLLSSNEFARTPEPLARCVAALCPADQSTIELMAGNGNISMYLPGRPMLVERVRSRVDSGRIRVPHGEWHVADIFSKSFLDAFVCAAGARKFERVVANPDFEFAVPALYVALLLLSSRDDARIVFVLPSDFFESSASRSRGYRIMNVEIETEYRTGRWCYYPERNRKPTKLMSDSIFVFKRGKGGQHGHHAKYGHPVRNIRVQGILETFFDVDAAEDELAKKKHRRKETRQHEVDVLKRKKAKKRRDEEASL